MLSRVGSHAAGRAGARGDSGRAPGTDFGSTDGRQQGSSKDVARSSPWMEMGLGEGQVCGEARTVVSCHTPQAREVGRGSLCVRDRSSTYSPNGHKQPELPSGPAWGWQGVDPTQAIISHINRNLVQKQSR